MSNKSTVSLKEAKRQFKDLIGCLTETDKSNFITYVFKELISYEDESGNLEQDFDDTDKIDDLLDDPVQMLNTIAEDIKTRIPLNAILPSEFIISPETGENSDCLPDLVVHVDDFLYNEDDVEELVDDGKLKKHFCKDCGSKNIEPLIFISHSLSRDALYYIFSVRLPLLENKRVLDIGSRLGGVLYGAYAFTDASHIVGVEMNEDLCNLQREVIAKYRMESRIRIVHRRIEEAAEEIEPADVIIINNSFEYYNSVDKQIEIWECLRKHMRSRSILVTCPPLETTFNTLRPNIVLDEWVKPYRSPDEATCENDIEAEYPDHRDISFYEIL